MKPVINPDTRITVDEMLDSIPVRNESVEHKVRGENRIVLRVPLRKRWFMGPPMSLVFPFRTHRTVALDEIGTEVWEACDGSRSTEEIIDLFAGRHHISFHEARIGVVEFLQGLIQRGLVVILGVARKGAQQ